MSKFIKIKKVRIILSAIKRYAPLPDSQDKLVIYYTATRQRIDNEIFTFRTPKDMQNIIDKLDVYFGIL